MFVKHQEKPVVDSAVASPLRCAKGNPDLPTTSSYGPAAAARNMAGGWLQPGLLGLVTLWATTVRRICTVSRGWSNNAVYPGHFSACAQAI